MKTKLIGIIALAIGLSLSSCDKGEDAKPKDMLDTSVSSNECGSENNLTGLFQQSTQDVDKIEMLPRMINSESWIFANPDDGTKLILSGNRPNSSVTIRAEGTSYMILDAKGVIYTTKCDTYLFLYEDLNIGGVTNTNRGKFIISFKMAAGENNKIILEPHLKGETFPYNLGSGNMYEPVERFFVTLIQE
jgi:hypothetical protein